MKKIPLSVFTGLATLSIGVATIHAATVTPLSPGDEFYFNRYYSAVSKIGKEIFSAAATEGTGKDLARTRVYSYWYVNGQLIDTDSNSGVTSAFVEFTSDFNTTFTVNANT